MRAFGAELTLVPSEGGLTTKKLILDMIETARGLASQPNTYWTNQLENFDSIAGYHPLGEEIWAQTNGHVDAFVHSIGTGASIRVRRRRNHPDQNRGRKGNGAPSRERRRHFRRDVIRRERPRFDANRGETRLWTRDSSTSTPTSISKGCSAGFQPALGAGEAGWKPALHLQTWLRNSDAGTGGVIKYPCI